MEANGDRFYIGAVVILFLATSAVSGLECYCGQVIGGQPISTTPECRQDNTCTISDTSIGQCSLERTVSNGLETLRYTCLEVQSTQFDAGLALTDICNKSTTFADTAQTSNVDCCVYRNYCNHEFVEKPSSEETPQIVPSTSTSTSTPNDSVGTTMSDSTESPNWTAGTIVIASFFVVTFTTTVVVFAIMCVLLRRRAALRSVNVV